MSSQVNNSNLVEDDATHAFGTTSVRKSKKKKKLGLFSFRSKKTKTLNSNNVTSEQSDSVSVCSEILTTEDGSYSSTTSWKETHTNTVQSSQDTYLVRRPSSSSTDSMTKRASPAKEVDGQTANMEQENTIAEEGTGNNTAVSQVSATEDRFNVVMPVTEDEHSQQADNLSQPPHQQRDRTDGSHLQAEGEGNTVIPKPAEKSETTDVNTVAHPAEVALDRPNSIRLEPNSKASPFSKHHSSVAKQKNRIFAEQQQQSTFTDCSSYPVSPARGRFKPSLSGYTLNDMNASFNFHTGVHLPFLFSKKVKMTSNVGATHHLTVRLLSGQNLAARDINGLSDPYVKFKISGQATLYKSRICKATLNPKWGEEFTIPVKMCDKIAVRVFDRDIGMRDDFMGSSSFEVQSLIEDEETELSLYLEDEKADEQEELGTIHLAVTLVPIVDDLANNTSPEDFGDTMSVASLKVNSMSRSDSNASDISRRTILSEKYRKSKLPIGTATVQLVSGKELPARDSNGLSDPYVKLQIGKQRHKSKVCYKTLDPVWKEEFVFQLMSRESIDRGEPAVLEITVWDRDSYRKDDFIGRCELDIGLLDYDRTYNFNLTLTDTSGSIKLLVTLHSNVPSDALAMNNQFVHLKGKYSLLSSFSNISDIGLAEVKIIRVDGCRAADIGGKSDPFCVVELCNARAQTHTCYKTLDPVWNKTVIFSIKDIHDVLHFTVYDEDKDGNDFLGRIVVPLLRGTNGIERTYALKDRKLTGRMKGTITVQITYIFNPARAAIRTFSPREEKHMDQDPRFKRQLLIRNFSRVWACIQAVLQALEFVNSCFTWQNPVRSATAFVILRTRLTFMGCTCMGLGAIGCTIYHGIYLVQGFLQSDALPDANPFSRLLRHAAGGMVGLFLKNGPTVYTVYLLIVWNIELYMLPILLLLLLMKSYFDVIVQKTKVDRRLSIKPDESFQDDDDDEDIENTNNKVSLLQRIKAIEEVLLKVQNILNWIACLLERIHNTFTWSVPFLSTLAVIVLSVVVLLLYFVSLRTIALLWGINKFTKRLRKPNFIPNNELFDFLSRIPSEVDLDEFQEFPILQGSPKGLKKKK